MAPVLMRITEQVLVARLCLPEGTKLVGAQAEHYPHGSLVLYLEAPGAPERADEVHAVYEHNGGPDPVRLAELRWLARGDELAVTLVTPDDTGAR